jgi:uncharacterized protein involved in cysteine biosynthesis
MPIRVTFCSHFTFKLVQTSIMLALGHRLPALGQRLAPAAAAASSPYLSCVRFKRSAAKSSRVSAATGAGTTSIARHTYVKLKC